ncbi:MAG TPA: zinc ABC transporter substrate-binding protein [Mycobacteriales bacterium]|nr:zinc ABC transporter substrate-binding protein [Mycobacteriales bacterium]
MRRLAGRRRLLPVVALVAIAGCGSTGLPGSTTAGHPVRVVAAENVWGDIASQIGGRYVDVTSLISTPTEDPHLFESDPEDAAEVGAAQLVIENGLGYDDFVDRLLSAGSSAGGRLLSIQHVLGVTNGSANPHLWYWTARLPEVADAIARQLTAIAPAHAATFRANARRFDRSLKPLLATIAQIRAKYAGTPIAYTERVPGYLVAAAGLRLATPASFSQAIEDGNDPSPQDAAAFDADITDHRVKVLLYNSQVVDSQTTHIKQLAAAAHIPVVGVSETIPSGARDFQAWQLSQARALLTALGG